MPRLPAQPNQSLIDGLAVLQAVASQREPVGSLEVARLLELEPTRVNRLLKTLAYLGVIYQTRDRRYAPGPGMHVLAAQSVFASGLMERAAGPLAALTKLGLVVALGVLWRDQVAYLYHWQPGLDPVEAIGRTALFPAARSGLGRALLAALPTAQVEDLYGHDEALLATLDQVRQQGYAAVRTTDGMTVGMAFGDPVYAAVAVAGPLRKVSLDERVAALRLATAELTRQGA